MEIFLRNVENIVGKVEHPDFYNFFFYHFPHLFPKNTSSPGPLKYGSVSLTLTKRQIFRQVQIESICRRQNKCNLKTKIPFGMGRKHCGRRRKCWLPAFSPFPTMFSKCFFSRFV